MEFKNLDISESFHLKPNGYDSNREPTHAQQHDNLKIKKAWDIALSGTKSIPFNAFMLYMSGNSVQIFSILITVMLFFNSVKTMMSVNQTFDRFGFPIATFSTLISHQLFLPKLVFVAVQIGNFALGLWKCAGMGLLPTSSSDWLAFLEPRLAMEHSFGNMI